MPPSAGNLTQRRVKLTSLRKLKANAILEGDCFMSSKAAEQRIDFPARGSSREWLSR